MECVGQSIQVSTLGGRININGHGRGQIKLRSVFIAAGQAGDFYGITLRLQLIGQEGLLVLTEIKGRDLFFNAPAFNRIDMPIDFRSTYHGTYDRQTYICAGDCCRAFGKVEYASLGSLRYPGLCRCLLCGLLRCFVIAPRFVSEAANRRRTSIFKRTLAHLSGFLIAQEKCGQTTRSNTAHESRRYICRSGGLDGTINTCAGISHQSIEECIHIHGMSFVFALRRWTSLASKADYKS